MTARLRVAVVGVDLGPTGDEAILDALRLLAAGALDTLHVLHVVDGKNVLSNGRRLALELESEAVAYAPAALEERVYGLAGRAGFRVARSQVQGHGRLGDPVETLLQMCVDYEADLLIVGTHGRHGLDRLVAGSVAEQVVRRSHCPVLVAREKDYEGLEKTRLPDPPYAPGQAPQRRRESEPATHESTTLSSWAPSDNGPTGFRIV